MIKVTIIVPVYNAQNYIERCLKSLLMQGFRDDEYEIICIDDYSQDDSKKYLHEYEQRYSQVMCYYNKENKGVSYARNMGIKKAQGVYIAFCDADDWYEKNSIKEMYIKAVSENADFLISNYYLDKGKQRLKRCITNNFTNNPVTKSELIKFMDIGSYAKLIKKQVLIDNNLKYPTDLKRCEEYPIIPVAAYLSKKVVYIEDYTYNYFQNPESASNTIVKNYDFFEEAFERYMNYIDAMKYKRELEFRALEHLLYGKTLCMVKAGNNRKEIKKWIFKYEDKYGPINIRNIKKYGGGKRIFLSAIYFKQIWMLKILAKVHTILTA